MPAAPAQGRKWIELSISDKFNLTETADLTIMMRGKALPQSAGLSPAIFYLGEMLRMDRSKTIIRTSLIGIGVNLVLVLFKAAVGLISNSIAILLDAVNNLGDALSSIITIIGTKLAGKAPDRKHPYGHGRIEYLTSVLIAAIVIIAGLTSLKESFQKLIHPQLASYSAPGLIIIAVAVIAKFLWSRYVKSVGMKINSQSLIASGSDAFFDSILSLATLVAALISIIWQISLEGILGLVISAIILKAGCGILMESLNSIIGVRTAPELSRAVRATVNQFPGVKGSYDLTLHNYGPTETIGSIHIEVDDKTTARDLHKLTHDISAQVLLTYGITLTVGIYASNTTDPQVAAMHQQLEHLVSRYPGILQMHGFYADSETKVLSFDLIVDCKENSSSLRDSILHDVREVYPDYEVKLVLDSDYSD